MFRARPVRIPCSIAVAVAVSVWLLFNPDQSSAQVLYGTLVGNVTEESQAVIPGADVTVINAETGLTRSVVSNDSGAYSVPNLQAGTYSVTVKMPGFADFVATNVTVGMNSTVRRDVVMKVGGVQAELTVTAQAQVAQLQTDRGEIRHEIQTKQFEDLPVSLAGNYQSLLQTLPGFEMEGDMRPGRMGGCNPSGSVGFSVNGTTTSTTSTSVDGATNSHIWNVGRSAIVPTLESIEGVNVVTNSFDAEQGMAGGAVINVQTKSGTNQFHGSVFQSHFNQHMKARDYFRPASQPKGEFLQNRLGATLGGPIKKSKLFFFSSFGGIYQHDDGSSILSLPTSRARAGDFSNVSAVIYDPATGNPDGTGRVPFPNNQIPASRINPIARQVLNLVPLPNLPEREGSEASNFFASQRFSAARWSLDNKVNWDVSDKFNTFVSWNYAHHKSTHVTAFGDGFMDGPRVGGGNAGDTWGYNNRISVGANYIITPTLLVDAFSGWTRQNTNVEQPGIGENYGLDLLGLPGTNGPERFQSGWPRFAVSGYAGFGTEEPWTPYYRNDDQYSFRSNFTNIRGSHEIRWGTDINSEQMNHVQPEFQGGASTGARGLFSFGTGPTGACLATSASGACTSTSVTSQANAMAAFLLGLPNQVGKNSLNIFPYTTRTWRYSLYARDRWQASQKLTLNYGLRWEYFPMPTRADRGLERYNPEDNRMYIGGVGDVPEDLGVKSSKSLFAPRLGFAFRASERMVVRGGYGVSWDPYSLARALRTNHPVLTELVIPAPNSLSPASNLSAGIPPTPSPGLENGVLAMPSNVSAQTVPFDLRRGYIASYNLTVQRDLACGLGRRSRLRRDASDSAARLPGAELGRHQRWQRGTAVVQGVRPRRLDARSEPDWRQPLRRAAGQGAAPVRPELLLHDVVHAGQVAQHVRTRPERQHAEDHDSGVLPPEPIRERVRPPAQPAVHQHRGPAVRAGPEVAERRRRAVDDRRQLADQQHRRHHERPALLGDGLGQLAECSRQHAARRPGEAGRRDSRRRRARHALLRHQRIRAGDRGAVWHRRLQHAVRPRSLQLGLQPVPDLPDAPWLEAGVPCRGVQLHQHAEVRQPAGQRQQRRVR